MEQNELKQMVGQAAVKYVEDGMIVGLGSGSTVRYMVDALGKRVQEEKMDITCVATSKYTENQARNLGMTVKSIDEVDHIDLTIDGADEISRDFNGIKGGGAAHLWEKIVAINSRRNIWIVDESKMVDELGAFPLPLEVIPFGSSHVFEKLERLNFHPEFRMKDGHHVRTDSNNYIIDLHLGKIEHPAALADQLNGMVGMVEHGLFLNIVDLAIVGTQDGVKIVERPTK